MEQPVLACVTVELLSHLKSQRSVEVSATTASTQLGRRAAFLPITEADIIHACCAPDRVWTSRPKRISVICLADLIRRDDLGEALRDWLR